MQTTLRVPLFAAALACVLAACSGSLTDEAAVAETGSDLTLGSQPGAQACTNFEPGCGSDPIPAAGCYVECTSDADCGNGRCEKRNINPCPADPNGGAVCTACGMDVTVCLPTTHPGCTDLFPGCGPDPLPAAACYSLCETRFDCQRGEICEDRSAHPCPPDANGVVTCRACDMRVKICTRPTAPCEKFEPGCGQNPVPAPGCYVPCSVDYDCPNGTTCQQRSINPCVPDGSGGPICQACGMTTGVCL